MSISSFFRSAFLLGFLSDSFDVSVVSLLSRLNVYIWRWNSVEKVVQLDSYLLT
jgi:hypothetical protein